MSRAVWDRPEFVAGNRSSTALWGGGFAGCDLIAVLAGQPWRPYGPIVSSGLAKLPFKEFALTAVAPVRADRFMVALAVLSVTQPRSRAPRATSRVPSDRLAAE